MLRKNEVLTNLNDSPWDELNRESIEKSVNEIEVLELLGKSVNGVMGELGSAGTYHRKMVELAAVSHIIRNIRIEGDNIVGDVTILDTPKGRIVQDMIKTIDGDVKITYNMHALSDAMGNGIMDKIIKWNIEMVEPKENKDKEENNGIVDGVTGAIGIAADILGDGLDIIGDVAGGILDGIDL